MFANFIASLRTQTSDRNSPIYAEMSNSVSESFAMLVSQDVIQQPYVLVSSQLSLWIGINQDEP